MGYITEYAQFRALQMGVSATILFGALFALGTNGQSVKTVNGTLLFEIDGAILTLSRSSSTQSQGATVLGPQDFQAQVLSLRAFKLSYFLQCELSSSCIVL